MTEFKFEGIKNSYSYINKKNKKIGKIQINNFDLTPFGKQNQTLDYRTITK